MGRHRPKGDERDYAQALNAFTTLNVKVKGCGVGPSLLPDECLFAPLMASARFWRTLSLELLRACQRRDPSVARTVGLIAEKGAANIDLCLDQVPVDSGVLRRLLDAFEKEVTGSNLLLRRGKSKPPPTIHDDALVDLYCQLRHAIKAVRHLEKNRKPTESAAFVINKTYALPNPFGLQPDRTALIESLAEQDTRARVSMLFVGAARWVGLPDPPATRLEKMHRVFLLERPPAEAAKLILAALTGLSPTTVTNRLAGRIRLT